MITTGRTPSLAIFFQSFCLVLHVFVDNIVQIYEPTKPLKIMLLYFMSKSQYFPVLKHNSVMLRRYVANRTCDKYPCPAPTPYLHFKAVI